ncbi:arginase [Halohasta litchfieldiae]|jgi:arginase|uniref:Arginase n=1 Tax=Halohasta litchfieldiae TaxID=1073996 RepID=A0A1H6VWY5_9EURY|nr:arginase [Halohasta litchfieldiae]ATW87276.1 arginase [Halohasta litchfieldiae]SEJ09181.1 arginase [Halohasta litchfieldiae]
MTRTVRIIGAPTDYGANRRGVDMGPSAIRYAGLADQLRSADTEPVDAGDIRAPHAEECDPDTRSVPTGTAQFFEETKTVCTQLADTVESTLETDELPIVLGGDHSVAIGSVRGSAAAGPLGAIWFDAHADLNTPATSPSGNIHGMPLAALLGIGEFADQSWATAPHLREENLVLVGLRSVDEAETRLIEQRDFTVFTMSEIDSRGITAVVEEALAVATDGVDEIHVSLDLDWLDPTEAPGVGTPVRGGVTYREAHSAMEQVAATSAVRSLDLVEVNPTLDQHNETAELATELAASALGKRIL